MYTYQRAMHGVRETSKYVDHVLHELEAEGIVSCSDKEE